MVADILARPKLPSSVDFTYELYGFTLTSGPPAPTGVEEWAPSPTEEKFAESAQAFGVAETMSFQTSSPVDCSSISWDPTKYDAFYGAPFYWLMWFRQSWVVKLSHQQSYALTFSVRAGSEDDRTFYTSAAGHEFPSITIDNSTDFTDITFHVPADLALSGSQTFSLRTRSAFMLESVTFTPIITASYHWESVKKGIVYAGLTDTIIIEAESGTSDTEDKASSFAKNISVSASVNSQTLFADISAELNANYSESGYYGASIEISKFERISSSNSVTAPDGALSVTYQFWQPVLKFKTADQSIDQSSVRDLIPRRYVEVDPLPVDISDILDKAASGAD